MYVHGQSCRTIFVADDGFTVAVIDQTRLPFAFELRHLRNDLVYRKPAPGDSPYDPWHAAAAAAVARAERGGR